MRDDAEAARLLDEVEEQVRNTRHLTGRSSLAARVVDALRRVPRDAFVPAELRWAAYDDRPLPIGYRQTIWQPFIVALMSELIDAQKDDVVLEIGSGSGYQAAVLAQLVRHVHSLEIIDALAGAAALRLRRPGIDKLTVSSADGHRGLPEHAPYDAIVVTAATPVIPPALIEQLKPGGRRVIPVGDRCSGQELRLIRKDAAGQLVDRPVLPVVLVPLTGDPDRRAAGAANASGS